MQIQLTPSNGKALVVPIYSFGSTDFEIPDVPYGDYSISMTCSNGGFVWPEPGSPDAIAYVGQSPASVLVSTRALGALQLMPHGGSADGSESKLRVTLDGGLPRRTLTALFSYPPYYVVGLTTGTYRVTVQSGTTLDRTVLDKRDVSVFPASVVTEEVSLRND